MPEFPDLRVLLLLLLLPGGPEAARADDSSTCPLKSVRLGLVVSRLSMSELGRRPPNEGRELLRGIRAGLESCFARVTPLAGVGRARTVEIDALAILRVRLTDGSSGDLDHVDVELEFWTPRAARLTAIKAAGEGPRAGEDVVVRVAHALRADAPRLRRSIGSDPNH